MAVEKKKAVPPFSFTASVLRARACHFFVLALSCYRSSLRLRSAGKKYKDAVRWRPQRPISKELADLEVKECKAEYFKDCDIVFSGLDSDVAGEVEMSFIKEDIAIFSNAKNYRKPPVLPPMVPTVNIQHLDLIPHQRKHFGLTKALQDKFGPAENVEVFTQQAISGAGYPGVPSSEILDNTQILIPGEEDKLETEAQKILGAISSDRSAFEETSGLTIGATCTRVPVIDGHMAFVSLRFGNGDLVLSAGQAKQAMREYVSEAQELGCPSALEQVIVVFDELDRLQPRLDRDISRGYAVSVGRVRDIGKGSHFDLRFAALSYNTVIGAADSSILNAEAAILNGYI